MPKALIALLIALFVPPAVAAQTPTVIVDPVTLEFSPSPDHDALTPDTKLPLVTGYRLQVVNAATHVSVFEATLGKPTPEADGKIRLVRATVAPAPPLVSGVTYEALISVMGPGGTSTSEPSNQFSLGTIAPPIDPPIDPLPPAGDESPNGTTIPPAVKIVSATNHTWTLNGTDIYRDNQSANNGKGTKLEYVNKTIYAFGTDTKWYLADETNPQVYWAQLAGEPPLPPPDPSVLKLTCPANLSAVSPTGQPFTVAYAAPVATGGTAPINVVSSPASGSAFPIGSTSVTGTATDAANLTATCTFTVLVVAQPAPVFDCVASPLKFITKVTFPSAATGSQLRWQTNRPAVMTFDPFGARWTATATDKNGCSVTATR